MPRVEAVGLADAPVVQDRACTGCAPAGSGRTSERVVVRSSAVEERVDHHAEREEEPDGGGHHIGEPRVPGAHLARDRLWRGGELRRPPDAPRPGQDASGSAGYVSQADAVGRADVVGVRSGGTDGTPRAAVRSVVDPEGHGRRAVETLSGMRGEDPCQRDVGGASGGRQPDRRGHFGVGRQVRRQWIGDRNGVVHRDQKRVRGVVHCVIHTGWRLTGSSRDTGGRATSRS